MKKLILSMMALAAIATANAEEVVTTVENNNETTVEAVKDSYYKKYSASHGG